MSVIAKMQVRARTEFGNGSLLELGCLCDNDLMAAYAESDEDKLFTKYSPWGEMKLHQPAGYDLTNGVEDRRFYVMILANSEVSDEGLAFEGAVAVCRLHVVSVTDFGDNMAKRVEMIEKRSMEKAERGIAKFNWKMSIDNPGATNQLRPGVDSYWMALYPADKFDRNGVIAAAHA